MLNKIKHHYQKREFPTLLAFVFIVLAIGTIFYHYEEGWGYFDAFYFSVTTLTTVGYGDLVPSTAFSKLFTVFYLFLGVGIILGFFNAISKKAQQQHPFEWIFHHNEEDED